jgi:methyl-accepting chemotaxis protein
MNLSNLKIAVRLALLGAFFVAALLVVAFSGWNALRTTNAHSGAAMAQSAILTDAIDTARSAQVEFKIQVQEWKNILLRGNDPAQLEKYTAAFKKAGVTTRADLAKVDALLGKLSLKTPLVGEADKAIDELQKNYLSALEKYDSAKPESASVVDGLVKGMDREPTKKVDAIVAYMQEQSTKVMAAAAKESEENQRVTVLMLLGTLLVTAAVGAVVMVWLIRSITRPLNEAVDIAETVARGDLTGNISVEGNDEISTLLTSLKNMHDSLASIVGKVRSGTDAIAHASAEIAVGNSDLSSRTEEQASSLEETASSMEELTSTVKQNSENATTASKLASTASDVAVRGGEAVSQVIHTMGSINDSSKKIVDIIGVIDGIAFQTNILALNAAVEAARAGEQGRGFAVVASEVRNLAQRSAAAAKEIKALISDSVERVEAGTKLVGQAGTTMDEVVDSVKRVTSIISEIAVASGQQNDGIDQINDAISQMDSVTQQNAALVEEAAAAAEAMQQQAASLSEAVSVFKIDARHMTAAPAVRRTTLKAAPVRTRAPAAKLPAAKPAAAAATGGDDGWETF